MAFVTVTLVLLPCVRLRAMRYASGATAIIATVKRPMLLEKQTRWERSSIVRAAWLQRLQLLLKRATNSLHSKTPSHKLPSPPPAAPLASSGIRIEGRILPGVFAANPAITSRAHRRDSTRSIQIWLAKKKFLTVGGSARVEIAPKTKHPRRTLRGCSRVRPSPFP